MSSLPNIQTVEDWGGNTINACKEIEHAKTNNVDIIKHYGYIDTCIQNIRTISNMCRDCDIELIIYTNDNVTEPSKIYPHVTFMEVRNETE